MSRTQTRYDCDTGYADGVINLGPATFDNVGVTPAVLTRTAKGNVYLAQAAGETVNYLADLGGMLFRTGLQDYTQNRFGAGGLSRNPFGAMGGVRVGTPTTTSTASVAATGNGVAATIPVMYSALFTVGSFAVIDVGSLQ